MKKTLISFLFILLYNLSFSQCNVVATAISQPALCNGSCDGSITYVYQNIGAPGAPYIVTLTSLTSGIISITTYMDEFLTIPFTGLCAGGYSINIQGTSCNFITSAFISEPTPIVAYANTTDPSFGDDNGSLEIIATGGTPSYTYSIDGGATFQSSNTFTDLSAGDYDIIVMDNNGCEETFTATLTDNTVCNIVVTGNPTSMVSCFGACNGGLQYIYYDANNNSPYQIQLMNGSTVVQTQTNASSNGSGFFTNLCPGIYSIVVTDADGCVGTYPFITIIEPSQLIVTGVSTSNASAGMNNGSATITASGGTPSYTYSLDGSTFQASNIFTGLAAGVYIVYVKDSNGCISIFTFVIEEDPGCFFNTTATISNQLSCAWSCDAVMTYIFSGAPTDPPFNISLAYNGNVIQTAATSSQTYNGTFTNLCAGDYVLTVTNSSGCQEVFNLSVAQPSQVVLTATQINPSVGMSNGSITATATGGTAPYEYSIDGGVTWQSSNNFSGLSAGVYIVHVQDANGCIAIYTIVLQDYSACSMFLTAVSNSTSCANSCDGEIIYTFNDPGNNPPYTIDLIQGTTTLSTNTVTVGNGGSGTFTNLCEGAYVVELTDADGCTQVQTVYVDEPNPLVVSNVIVTDATVGNSDGEAEVIVTGGTAPYQFSLDNGTTWTSSNVLTGLAQGVYIMYVQDANGCQTIYCFVVNETTPTCNIATTIFLNQPISCYGACDGVIAFAYSDGSPNPPYTVSITNNGNVVYTSTETTPAMNGTITNACAGVYSITVTDNSGCISFASTMTLTEPQPLTATATVVDASGGSANGSATILANGGTGQYQFSIDGGLTWQNSNTFNNLSAGTYIAHVQDENGCMTIHTFIVGTNASCALVLTAFNGPSVTCGGACDGVINFAYSDGSLNAPYTVTISNSSGGTQTQTFTSGMTNSGSFTNLCVGVYVVSVTSANGCNAVYTVQVLQPDYMVVNPTWVNATAGNNDGSINLNITGGTAPYQYSIDNAVTWNSGTTIPNLGAGFYIIHVQDANGCMQIVCVILDDSNVIGFDENANEFSVYPNPTNGIAIIAGDNIEYVEVYSISGKLIQSVINTNDNQINLNLSEVESGIYLVKIYTADSELHLMKLVKE